MTLPQFTAHNIRLADGTYTHPSLPHWEDGQWCQSFLRTLTALFPGTKTDRSKLRIADLGCLEGGNAVEIARLGFQVLGVEVRASNFAACQYVEERVELPNLSFVQNNVWELAQYGEFDAVLCSGLLYHLDRPRAFLNLLSRVTRKALILHTHYAAERKNPKFLLSDLEMNEGLEGRWYIEFADAQAQAERENNRWASWDNARSFWVRREDLLLAIHQAGFGLVYEQFDWLAPDMLSAMRTGYYATDDRGLFVGVKP